MPAAQEFPWEALPIVLPLIGGLACFVWIRLAVLSGLMTAFGILVSVTGLSWQVAIFGVRRYTVGGWGAPLGIDLYADGLSLLMLSVAALVGLGVSIYASAYFEQSKARHFWPLWLFLWSALNALFLAADIFNLYVTLEFMGLAAVALVALAGGADALRAAIRYLLVSLLGSMLYLLGVALLYHGFGSLDIDLLSQRIEPSPVLWTAMGFIGAGLLLKTALFPLHFWLPPAHSNAPAPVSALLSALVVKGSFYIFLRLWLELFQGFDIPVGQLLGLLGASAVFWGGFQALRQTRLKAMIAYSTVAQLGYLFLGFALNSITAWMAILYLVLSHALAKAAMFLSAGSILRFAGHDRIQNLDRVANRLPLTLAAFSLAGVSSMGLPPSGGFVAKWMLLETALGAGQWWWSVVLILGGLLTAAYVFKVIGHAFMQDDTSDNSRTVPAVMEWTSLAFAVAVILLGFIAPAIFAFIGIGSPFAVGTVK